MSFSKLSLPERISAVNIDCMKHKEFAMLSGFIMMGKSEVRDDVPTACTNGKDKLYGSKFIANLSREQLRYVVLHENIHVGFKHCVLPHYKALVKKYGPQLCNIAMDYVVNGTIEQLDPNGRFVKRPIENLCIDPKYFGMSFPEVLRALIEDAEQGGQGGQGDQGGDSSGGDAHGQTLDDHEMSTAEGDAADKLQQEVEDAARQGKMIADRMRGDGVGGRDIFGIASQRQTNWRDALREFINTICAGDDQSRFCPPNKRLLASGFIMPSHFSESTGEIVIAADTSASMSSIYPVLFGEVARICEHARPESVRLLWWDTAVCSEQVFKPDAYERISSLLSPKGGGGTSPKCVANYLVEKQIKPKAVVWLTDGYIGDEPHLDAPSLWGVVDNTRFTSAHGKTIHINL